MNRATCIRVGATCGTTTSPATVELDDMSDAVLASASMKFTADYREWWFGTYGVVTFRVDNREVGKLENITLGADVGERREALSRIVADYFTHALKYAESPLRWYP
ncbi:MAG: hypothetical protein EKK42_20120 [Pseudonocardiaceae bacterium]|nr:MAG: hypothetical protein EKK42_20120 [Pseudonocardiaceae bacterium]